MDRGHEALLDTEIFLEQHVDHGRQAVGGAARVRDDVVLAGVVLVVVDAHDDGDVLALGGREMITFLAPAARCPLAFSASVNRPVDSITYSTPSCFHGRTADLPCRRRHLILWPLTISTSSSAAPAVFLGGHGAVEMPLGRVVLEQVSQVVGRHQVVDRHHVELLAQQSLLHQGTKDQPANPAKPIDPDFHCRHVLVSFALFRGDLAENRPAGSLIASPHYLL